MGGEEERREGGGKGRRERIKEEQGMIYQSGYYLVEGNEWRSR